MVDGQDPTFNPVGGTLKFRGTAVGVKRVQGIIKKVRVSRVGSRCPVRVFFIRSLNTMSLRFRMTGVSP